jgi:transposase-like protein
MSRTKRQSTEAAAREIRRKTRRKFAPEEKVRIVLEGLRGEQSISELCRREGIASNLYYRWSKGFLEAGMKQLAGDTVRAEMAVAFPSRSSLFNAATTEKRPRQKFAARATWWNPSRPHCGALRPPTASAMPPCAPRTWAMTPTRPLRSADRSQAPTTARKEYRLRG